MMSRRKWITALASLTVLAVGIGGAETPAARAEDSPAGISLGDAIPMSDTPLKNVDGKDVTLQAVAGKKGTLVIFSCNACPWVKAWQSRIVALGNAYNKRGVGVVVINSNDPGQNAEDGYDVMVARAKENKMAFPYVVDATSDVARAFGATRTPEAFLFDAEGKLVYHGTIDDNAKEPSKVKDRYLDKALKAVSTGKEVSMKETKSLGCGIKFRNKSSS